MLDAAMLDGGSMDAAGRDATTLPSGPVDPACLDGMYSEVLPSTASIDDITFSGDIGAYVDAVLDRRYPTGATLVRGGRMDTGFGQPCDELFAGSPSSGDDVMQRLNTIVHECGHIYDGFLSSGSSNVYVFTSGLQISCDRGDSTSRGGDTFARSRINGDEYSSMRPPCSGGSGCDFYGDIYLDGDPDDGMFDGGDQGFNMLFDEAVQYVNSLAVEWAYLDQASPGFSTSARDGILTLLWYVERYLRMARLSYPGAYSRLSTDACWREAILTLWGRAWLYLGETEGIAGLSIDDSIEALVLDTELLGEIQRIRDLHGC